MDPDTITKAKQTLQAAADYIDTTQEQIALLTTRVKDLETLGVSDASEYWREGKYLYLISPMNNGHRRRQYIGSNPQKVQEALDSIDRFKSRRQVLEQRSQLLAELQRILHRINDLLWLRRPAQHVRW